MPSKPPAEQPASLSQITQQESLGELPPDLPVIHEAILNADTLNQLFDDVSQCTHLIEVIVKHDRLSQTPDANFSLEQARELFEHGSAMGIQLRYQYDGAQWWDTLMRTPAGTRIVRIRHDLDSL